MISFFYGRIATSSTGDIPAGAQWPAWWGLGAEGWDAGDDVSVNTPTWVGDRRQATDEERSIDAAALLIWSVAVPADVAGPLRSSVRRMVSEGQLQPRIAGDLVRLGEVAALPASAMVQYGRSARVADLEDLVWVQALLADG
jgi:hypothetical protein